MITGLFLTKSMQQQREKFRPMGSRQQVIGENVMSWHHITFIFKNYNYIHCCICVQNVFPNTKEKHMKSSDKLENIQTQTRRSRD